MNQKQGQAYLDREITSAQNTRIKQVIRLRSRAGRNDEGLMIVEGRLELKRALAGGIRPISLFYNKELHAEKEIFRLIRECEDLGAELFNCASEVFAKIVYRERGGGLLAVAAQPKHGLNDINLGEHPLLIVAESIEKPGNLGAILRSADAAGANAVIVCDKCTDIYNPNVIRASIGTVFSVPVAEASSESTLEWLRSHKIKIFAATPDAQRTYTEADMREKTAFIMGEEHAGLSSFWTNEADMKIRIPMLGKADSLNVASAATILLFEAVRQRFNS